MRIRREYTLREMAGEHVVVVPGAVGTAAPTRIVSLNASASLLWELFREREFSPDDVADALVTHYEVCPDVARNDARSWIERLAACGILEE